MKICVRKLYEDGCILGCDKVSSLAEISQECAGASHQGGIIT
jgi:hypothetical protein